MPSHTPPPDFFSSATPPGLPYACGNLQDQKRPQLLFCTQTPWGLLFQEGQEENEALLSLTLSTPPTPQEAGLQALTSHLADI